VALFRRRGALIGQRRERPPLSESSIRHGYCGIARMIPVVAVLFRQGFLLSAILLAAAQAAGHPAAILLQKKTVDKFQKYFRHKRTPIRLIR
jgi:hypothetical protein